jgi:2-C-methyl-D-erythritol 2,4-cyclodiphosphate synthase
VRIGHGYDAHRLAEGRKLVLCGVEIPFDRGLLGHSDADVALHALMDALLGAAALGDIGRHFPDGDPGFAGISSLRLLTSVSDKLRAAGFKPVNADITIIAQRPKLAPYILEMRENVARILKLDLGCVSVKATTEEGLGFSGSGEGMAAHAVALIDSIR